ncbi:SGNH/GDSL hydrolase family protein [Pararobbsia silviterrae]|uniref:SGNH/GDSL hydrolase family protein n=1 Tax=Pararobbsia silviterrae TaxID=1792498 RepID=A0A494X1M3_9BURK|nr:SGNH/GDSL hydrolase family protein [Pararobbsia silviterrae]RKP43541.1 SGNH/GDSL hydrolase family protein [Pararobbsia silviterrae]
MRAVLVTSLCPIVSMAAQTPRVELPSGWVATWSAAAQAVAPPRDAPSFNRAPETGGRTVRQIVFPALSGSAVRVRLTNAFGAVPVTLRSITLGASSQGADIVAGTMRPVTFDGKTEVTLAPGAAVWSDAVSLPVSGGRPLALSFAAPANVRATTWHKVASQVSYISGPGDVASETNGAAFRARITSYLWLDRMAVEAPGAQAIVAIGDSITDGMRSTLNANRRWPDRFGAIVSASGGAVPTATVNAGISGNRLLNDSPCYGQALEARFAGDALGQPGVRDVIELVGINDINFGWMPAHAGLDCDVPHVRVKAADLIAGYQRLIAAAHERHVRILGSTLTPASLPPEREQIRAEVNAWIRTSRAFDAVVDFDAALRDPSDPTRLLARYDSDDHVHPSDAGYQRMAEVAFDAWSKSRAR